MIKLFKITTLAVITLLSMAFYAYAQSEYSLNSGDRVKVTVFGEAELSGEFEIDSTGSVSFPLIGPVRAKGLTPRLLEREIDGRLRDGYLVSPKVSVEVLNYQPVYVIGEVNTPGSFPYRAGLTVINAVAVAGGFTFRADEDDIEITRGGDQGSTFAVRKETIVLPGDVVRVKERFF